MFHVINRLVEFYYSAASLRTIRANAATVATLRSPWSAL